MDKIYRISQLDDSLRPYMGDINLRMQYLNNTLTRLGIKNNDINAFANGFLYYGFHKTPTGWVYREWAPGAAKVALVGDFNGWCRTSHPLTLLPNGNWEIQIPEEDGLAHLSLVKTAITTKSGDEIDRIPLYCKRAVTEQGSSNFNGQLWHSEYQWKNSSFTPNSQTPLIYEAHIGIASEEETIANFAHFTKNVLPRIHQLGYNTIQLMAIAEHPYYASFGYQVSNYFAVSSRFGTPDEFKELIDTAHQLGIAVLLDIVHSHTAPNTLEGLAAFDGTDYQFCLPGQKGWHPAWGSRLFDYGKTEVLHFLLSNLKFWLEEYHIDGFRFDGVTSMLYHDHGLNQQFTHYSQYFSPNTNLNATSYLQLATLLCRQVKPACLLIAEEVSGMPGTCLPVEEGGLGFEYRLNMGLADYWHGLAKTTANHWNLGLLWHELTQKRPMEKVIGYCESHDQAIVGHKTLMLWLAGEELYTSMAKSNATGRVTQGISLHKIMRLITCVFGGEGYLNFIGNEFGHPDWIDFPREGNQWSFFYATRRWSLADDTALLYSCLQAFDEAMLALYKTSIPDIPVLLFHNEWQRVLAAQKGGLLYVFNFGENQQEIQLPILNHSVSVVFNSQWESFGGNVPLPEAGRHVSAAFSADTPYTFSIAPFTALVLKPK